MQGADLFALTSHSENFGVAVLEALAVGLPVLVTPGVALAGLVKEERLGYVPELDITAISSLLKRALEHPQEAKSMGEYARKLVLEKYTWRNISNHLIEIYNKIIKHYELFLMQ